ncbi:MAG: type I restriction enzyme HsdR N-terminal domain-containing protein [Desulfobacterales bacterium]|nr:type I restriction enzyme HsdR N-terminal domain-containing protein [Desulfobacterales bacterium]MDJ0856195.1 type I restriction enzyme HsdR N-terminal domain-containing protein [Desulfobacterales bacterium]MDJ0887310.1 type I restriction enzyme HsdR N-terminal domain-containing protein [Desulfobacterales bacterium]
MQDYLTGREIPDIGAEANRQAVARYLVEHKGYSKTAIRGDAPLEIDVDGEAYRSRIDLLVMAGEPPRPFMAVKCAPGSLGSREREIVSAARIHGAYQIPLALVSDGRNAIVLDTVSGRRIAEGMTGIPDAREADRQMAAKTPVAYPPERLEREKRIFRTYDRENVNIVRSKQPDSE